MVKPFLWFAQVWSTVVNVQGVWGSRSIGLPSVEVIGMIVLDLKRSQCGSHGRGGRNADEKQSKLTHIQQIGYHFQPPWQSGGFRALPSSFGTNDVERLVMPQIAKQNKKPRYDAPHRPQHLDGIYPKQIAKYPRVSRVHARHG